MHGSSEGRSAAAQAEILQAGALLPPRPGVHVQPARPAWWGGRRLRRRARTARPFSARRPRVRCGDRSQERSRPLAAAAPRIALTTTPRWVSGPRLAKPADSPDSPGPGPTVEGRREQQRTRGRAGCCGVGRRRWRGRKRWHRPREDGPACAMASLRHRRLARSSAACRLLVPRVVTFPAQAARDGSEAPRVASIRARGSCLRPLARGRIAGSVQEQPATCLAAAFRPTRFIPSFCIRRSREGWPLAPASFPWIARLQRCAVRSRSCVHHRRLSSGASCHWA